MAIKYDMKFGVSEVARMFDVNRDVVKTWAYRFSEYLKPEANPPKGTPRVFFADDLRVLAYVYMYWEDEPDYESIKIGLNTDSHFEEPYDQFLTTVTPLFQEPPEGLDETWRHGTIIGGMAESSDTFALAESYKLAGDMLVDAALSSDEVYELICPVIYNYRHATELYLKATLLHQRTGHDLHSLLQEFKEELKAEFGVTLPQWFENIVLAFVDFDPGSTTFRYGDFPCFLRQGEIWVDLAHMKTLMSWLAKSFQNVRHQRSTISQPVTT
jgi:hypothetical protein